MLFRINMYPAGRERRVEAQRRFRQLAALVAIAGANALIVVMFLVGLALLRETVVARQVRLKTAEQAIGQILNEHGGAMTMEELNLVRTRAAQVRWSAILASVSRVTPPEVSLSRLRLSEGLRPGARDRIAGLRLTGRLKAGSEQAGLSLLMKYLAALREDAFFTRHFLNPRLVDSTWLTEENTNLLEFDIFCPLVKGLLVLPPPGDVSSMSSDAIEVRSGDADANAVEIGRRNAGAL